MSRGIAGRLHLTVQRSRMPRGLRLDLTFHAKAFALNDHRVGVMQQPIQNGGGQRAIVVEDFGPLLEGPI